jgi:methanogenic corrinoid protein MtbC1
MALVHQRLEAGDNPLAIVEDCENGMRQVGERYEAREYFLAGLIMAGEIFREVMELVQPSMEQVLAGHDSGRVLIGTVEGDIHDIGKDIVFLALRCFGFTVEDLGVDVPPQKFLERAIAMKPDIIGLSGILTSSFASMRETVRVLRTDTPLEIQRIPILIGGGQLNEEVCHYIGADYWVNDGIEGVRLCRRVAKKVRALPD